LESLLATGSDPSSPFYGLATVLNGSNGSALGTFLNSNFFSTTVLNGAFAGGPFNPQSILQTMSGVNGLSGKGAATAAGSVGDLTASAGSTLASARLPGLGAAASAGIGHANLVGTLSVPPSWASTANITPAATALPATGLSDIGSNGAGGPGGLAPMATAGKRMRRAIPKYGFRPVVMPRPPAAG
jgi:hypothetical protein